MKVPGSVATECVLRNRALAATLTAARQHAGMTQRELAARLARVPSFVGKIETGSQWLKVWELVDYVKVLRLDPADLLRQIATGGSLPADDLATLDSRECAPSSAVLRQSRRQLP